ncbi:hypothetical protein H4R20_005614, partial [Coemansia guatemalensis]
MPPRPMPHATPATSEGDNGRSDRSGTPFSVPADAQQGVTSNGFGSQQRATSNTTVSRSAEPPTYASLLLSEGRVDDSFIDWTFSTADTSSGTIDTPASHPNATDAGASAHTAAAAAPVSALSAESASSDAAMYAVSAPLANTYEAGFEKSTAPVQYSDDKGLADGYPLSAPVLNTNEHNFNNRQTAPVQHVNDKGP